MIIYLIGPRAVGKSTLGAALAKALHLPFMDSDVWICQHAGCSVADIVHLEGWAGFRARESRALAEATHSAKEQGGAVIATGGGMVLGDTNRELMREFGTVFFLTAPLDVLQKRLGKDQGQRPSLGGVKSTADEMAEVLAERLPLYAATAHHSLDCTQPLPQLCKKVLEILKFKK